MIKKLIEVFVDGSKINAITSEMVFVNQKAFDYKITFVNSQPVCLKDFCYTKIDLTQSWYDKFN